MLLIARLTCLFVMSSLGQAYAQPADSGLAERGRQLTVAADCAACHTSDRTKPMAGGVPIPTPLGTIFAPNITPDPDTGIGSWTDEDFYRAMHKGVGKQGENLYPAFPYEAFTKLSRSDVLAIKAYLFSLPAIRQANLPSELRFPFDQRWILSVWKLLNFHEGELRPNPGRDPSFNRGAYLVEALAHCQMCHTPRTVTMGIDASRPFAGGEVGPWSAYNITSDPVSGVGNWSTEQLETYLHTGHVLDKAGAAGPMGDAVQHSFSALPDQDIHDIVTYLRSSKAAQDADGLKPRYAWGGAKEDVTAFRGSEDLDHPDGRTLFYGACASCHGIDGSGSRDHVFPSVFHNTATGASSISNLVMVILNGVNRTVSTQLTYMPGFAHLLSNDEVASIANYVASTYGNPGAANANAATIDALRAGRGRTPLIAKLLWPGITLVTIVTIVIAWALVWLFHVRRRRRSEGHAQ
jgi:mono/diheme cytochrome c family protein